MRTGKPQIGRFNVQPGMAFIMEDMENYLSGRPALRAGSHPWLITRIDDDCVEIIMCSLLASKYGGRYNTVLPKHNDMVSVRYCCPPMDYRRPVKAVLNTVTLFPKKELFTHRLSLFNNNTEVRNFAEEGLVSLCLSEKALSHIINKINKYLISHIEYDYDPFGYLLSINYLYDLRNGVEVPEWFTEKSHHEKFGWKEIKRADPNAVYPSEEKMHVYEKVDVKLLEIIRKRDNPHKERG